MPRRRTASSWISSAPRHAPARVSPSSRRSSGAAVIPGFALWSEAEQRYVLRFYPPVPITGDAARDTQTLQAKLEEVFARIPTSGSGFIGAGRPVPQASRPCINRHRGVESRGCSTMKRTSMNRLKRSPLHGSVFAMALSAAALLLSVLLRPYLPQLQTLVVGNGLNYQVYENLHQLLFIRPDISVRVKFEYPPPD